MDTEETTPARNKKKFLKMALGIAAVFAVLLGTAFFLTTLKNAKELRQETEVKTQVPVSVSPTPHIITEEEKRFIEARIPQASSSAPLTKKEKTVIEQRVWNTSNVTSITAEQKAIIETRIPI